MNPQAAWEKQQKSLELYKTKNPGLLRRPPKWPEAEVLREIGAWCLPKNKPLGYIRLFPQDFIVEEKASDGETIKINKAPKGEEDGQENGAEGASIYADLVKAGIPTNVAIERLAHGLGIAPNRIGFAGLKDAEAVTSQRISFPAAIGIEKLKSLKTENIHLSGFRCGKGAVSPGALSGNVFTIVVRTEKAISPVDFDENRSDRYGGP
jgi:TruD family tRNA pseudouridine synthase